MRRAPTSTEEFERRPKTARKSEIDTKTKLLNAAERLFSDKGIEAVSHRDIALAAAVNLAALNYHFRSRQAFIQAVIKRRVEPINAHRLAALARAARQMGGAPVPTDKILEAFFGPAVEDPNRSFQSSLWIGPDASPYRDYLIGLTMLRRLGKMTRLCFAKVTRAVTVARRMDRSGWSGIGSVA